MASIFSASLLWVVCPAASRSCSHTFPVKMHAPFTVSTNKPPYSIFLTTLRKVMNMRTEFYSKGNKCESELGVQLSWRGMCVPQPNTCVEVALFLIVPSSKAQQRLSDSKIRHIFKCKTASFLHVIIKSFTHPPPLTWNHISLNAGLKPIPSHSTTEGTRTLKQWILVRGLLGTEVTPFKWIVLAFDYKIISFALPHACHRSGLLHYRSKPIVPSDHRLKLEKLWDKIDFSSL